MEPFLAPHGPHLESARRVRGVTQAIEQRPMAVERQLQLLGKRDLQAVDGYRVLIGVRRSARRHAGQSD